MESVIKLVGLVVVLVAVATGLSLLLAFPITWLWNSLMPAIFDLPVITFWQAFGLNLLSSLLIRSYTSNTKG